ILNSLLPYLLPLLTSVLLPSPLFTDNYTAATQIYTLSLHDALPIFKFHRNRQIGRTVQGENVILLAAAIRNLVFKTAGKADKGRSEEHTSELQSRFDLVCRLLLEKKNR